MKDKPMRFLCLLLCVVFFSSAYTQDRFSEGEHSGFSGAFDQATGQDLESNGGYVELARGNAIKVKALVPHGNLFLGIELGLKNDNSIEFEAGFINIAGNEDFNIVGFEQKIGYKFILHKIFSYPVAGRSNLHGLFIKPEISGGLLIQRKSYTDENEHYGAASFFVLAGYQWVLGNIFVVDLYAGPGIPAIFHATADYENTANILGHYTVGKNVPFALAAGLKLGIHF